MRWPRKLIGGALIALLFGGGMVAGWFLAHTNRTKDAATQGMTDAPATSPNHQGAREVLYWYDAMNPSFHSSKPGKAPDGMDLVPKYADQESAMKNMPPGTAQISPRWQQLIGVRTDKVARKRLVRTIRTVGMVVPNATTIARVHVKIAGWVNKVYVNFVGKLVKKGDPLFSLYSPDLVSTEQEYLIARQGQQDLGQSPYPAVARGADSLLNATRERLRLWDISERQINQIETSGKVSKTITLDSPISGFVMQRNLYEQTYVTPETELYEIADLSTIWVEAQVYEYEAPFVHVGQRATMQLTYLPGKTYVGRVSYIYPTLDPDTRTVKVRLEFPNPNFELKPDMYANVDLDIDYGVQTIVPSEAVLNSGTRQIVFLAQPGGYFEPREIQVGPQVDDQYVVLGGLKAGDTIVTSGNFLIDSESRLGAAMNGMSGR